MDDKFNAQMVELWNSCESNKYLQKYGIHSIDNSSLSFKKFLLLVLSLENDKKENLKINFRLGLNTNFGRNYLRYSLDLKGEFYSHEVFIQIPYNKQNFCDGSLFTLLNIHIEINGIDYEIKKQTDELIKKCYLDFVTNYKH
jgi:hypothetical protein